MKLKLFTIVLLMFVTGSLIGQTRQLTGKVTSAKDQKALPGVTVRVKGTNIGTITGGNGHFTLSYNQSGGILVFSFIGG